MNIKRFIDRNGKLIWYVTLIIVFIFLVIKGLNSFYEEKDLERQEELGTNMANNEKSETQQMQEKDYTVTSDSTQITMASFVNYCNKRDLEKAYKMLTDECKNAMFPTVQDFERVYINNIYKIQRTFEMIRWSTDDDKITYLVTLYGDLLATGGTANKTQEYCTFVEQEDGTYKLNINNYIYGEERNFQTTKRGITVKIGHVDIYEEYERIEITINNNTSKKICLTGNKYKGNIYLQNSKETTYSSVNSKFDNEEIVLEPNAQITIWVDFNKVYSAINKAEYLVLSDVILNYEDYLQSQNKNSYSNRTSIKVRY